MHAMRPTGQSVRSSAHILSWGEACLSVGLVSARSPRTQRYRCWDAYVQLLQAPYIFYEVVPVTCADAEGPDMLGGVGSEEERRRIAHLPRSRPTAGAARVGHPSHVFRTIR
jgi:hypothetical protein